MMKLILIEILTIGADPGLWDSTECRMLLHVHVQCRSSSSTSNTDSMHTSMRLCNQ